MSSAIDKVNTKPRTLWLAFLLVEAVCIVVALSMPEYGADVFQRFGSIVVCIAVFFIAVARVSIEYSERHWMDVLRRNYDDAVERHIRLEQRLARQFGDDDDYVVMVRQEHEEFRKTLDPKSFQEELHGLRVKWFVAETFVLVFGTIQWGFGDLVVNRLVGCGAWQCN